jgi:hypothetical protein
MSPEPNALAKKRASTNDLSVRRTGRALDQRGWESKVHAKARAASRRDLEPRRELKNYRERRRMRGV